jgi:hypothetical protein
MKTSPLMPLFLLFALLRLLLGQKHGVDVGEDAAGRDGDVAQELGELLVVADRQLDVARHDAPLLVVFRGVTRELEHLRREVLQDGGQVDGGAAAQARGVLAELLVVCVGGGGWMRERRG